MLHRLMNGSRALTFVLALALVFSLTACDDDGSGTEPEPELLSEILEDRNDLSTLFDAVEASGQLNLTQNPGADITVFAPNNSAFADINLEAALSDDNSELLSQVVQYHVLPQSVLSSGLSEGTVSTSMGDEILITTDANGNFLINGNSITTADLEADNGVLHVIDGLLLENRTLLQRLGLTSSTQALLGIASEANLADAFSTAENWTVFTPVNEALAGVDPANFPQEQLQQILRYHVIVDENGPIDAATLQTLLADNGGEVSVQTLQGEDITFTETDSGISINNGQANIVLEGGVDRFAGGLNEAGDGFVNVFHLIDGLLMPPSMQEATTIADVVADDESFSTLLTALQEAGLADDLGNEEETFTVFAPNDDAFAPINTDVLLGQADALEAVLGYHVVPGQALAASDLAEGENTVTTLAGDELTVVKSGDNVFVEGSQVVNADIETDNGIIHVIDRTLLGNQNLANAAWFVSETEQLYNTVVDFGLADAFVNASDWTVFGPNNATFENADLSGFSEEEVQQVLQYHVYAESAVDSEGLVGLLEDNGGSTTIPTLQGEDLTIAQDGDQIVFNDGQATLDMANLDYTASNGILHVIDGLLLPPSIVQDNADAISYDLAAQSNSGAIPEGVSGTATFWRYTDSQTIVTLELTDGATGASVSHPAHIHNGSAEEGGSIEFYLTPLDGSGGGGTSARVIDVPFGELTEFDGYINIHESVENLGNVVSQGNIGANASGTVQEGLDFIESPRTTDYDLAANANEGSVAPDGVPATATFLELTSDLTLVTLDMTINGATEASVSHPAHIHNGTAAEGGSIEYYLAPIDGSDTASRSSKIVSEPYDTLTGFDGYINIHESVANLGAVVSQGNIGANAGLTSIADAREQGVDAEVTIEGTVTRAFGDFVRIQDASGELGASGMVIRQPSGSFNDEIADGTITEGTTLRVTGTISEFNGLLQINEDDLASYEITGDASVPDPLTITLTELNENGLAYESVLVRINGLTLDTEDTEFSNGASYTAVDGDGNEATFRVQREGETQLGGEPVPSGTFDYRGVIGQFEGTPQMIPVEVSDLIQE